MSADDPRLVELARLIYQRSLHHLVLGYGADTHTEEILADLVQVYEWGRSDQKD